MKYVKDLIKDDGSEVDEFLLDEEEKDAEELNKIDE